MNKTIVGVMGPGSEATKKDVEIAKILGELIAKNNWILLSGGMRKGVMEAVNISAKKNGGLTLGILPNDDTSTHSEELDISIITNMGAGRNYINAASSHFIIAIGMSPGTASEICFAIQLKKNVILLNQNEESINFFNFLNKGLVHVVENPYEAIELIKKIKTKQNKK